METAAPKPKVEVVINSTGVEVVRLYGSSWADEEIAIALLQRLRPLLRQVPGLLGVSALERKGAKPS
jgi:hypothetical protein